MKLAWLVMCQRALLDQTNNISLVQVLDEIGIPAPPEGSDATGTLIPLQCAVVAFWRRSVSDKPESAQTRARILGPDGHEISKLEVGVNLTNAKSTRWIGQLAGIPYRGPGTYVATMEVEARKRWRRVGGAEFTIHHNVSASGEIIKKSDSEPARPTSTAA